jgi:hypothetical protein
LDDLFGLQQPIQQQPKQRTDNEIFEELFNSLPATTPGGPTQDLRLFEDDQIPKQF